MDRGKATLREYQHEAADWLYEHDHTIVQAKVGAGKTATAITAMSDALRDGLVNRWLVVAPKRVCTHVWPNEIPLWSDSLRYAVAVGTPQERRNAIEGRPPNDVTIINYENLQWLIDHYGLDMPFNGLVLDEVTKLKDPSGKRFKALFSVIDKFKLRWGLTASFTSNGLEGVFGQCKIIDQKILGRSKGAFLQKWFYPIDRQRGNWAPRRGAYEAVMSIIKPKAYILEPAQYANTLPPVTVLPTIIDMPDELEHDYKKMKRDFALETSEGEITAVNAAVMTGKLQQLAAGFIYDSGTVADPSVPGKFITYRDPYWLSDHKMDYLRDLMGEMGGEHMMVVFKFEEELAQLRLAFPEGRCITDSGAIDEWCSGHLPVLFLHPKSGGHGLNLQSGGCTIVWTVPPWPEEVEMWEQVNGRLHRSGQTREVTVHVLLSGGTIDQDCWRDLQDNIALAAAGEDMLKRDDKKYLIGDAAEDKNR